MRCGCSCPGFPGWRWCRISWPSSGSPFALYGNLDDAAVAAGVPSLLPVYSTRTTPPGQLCFPASQSDVAFFGRPQQSRNRSRPCRATLLARPRIDDSVSGRAEEFGVNLHHASDWQPSASPPARNGDRRRHSMRPAADAAGRAPVHGIKIARQKCCGTGLPCARCGIVGDVPRSLADFSRSNCQ